LNRNKVVEILRLISCENLVCDRKEFIFDRSYGRKDL